MYCILSKEPISNFFEAENQREYMESKDFFILESMLTKKNFYEKIHIRVNFYALFDNAPLYMAVMTDNYFYNHKQKSNINSSLYVKWDKLPDERLPFEEQKKYVLPKEQRLWDDLGYFIGIYQMVITHNFRVQPYYEIKLNGNLETSTIIEAEE